MDTVGTIWMHVAVVEEAALAQQPETLEELPPFRTRNHRYIQHSVIRNGVWCLPITVTVADTYRHVLPRNTLGINLHNIGE